MFLDRYEQQADVKTHFGGQSAVYKCIDVRSRNNVAVKVTKLMSPQLSKSFQREVKALTRLDHDGVVEILDYGIEESTGFVVMPWMAKNLDEYLFEHNDLTPLKKYMNFVIPLVRALSFAHDNEVFHRDIKPSNVLLDESFNPILSDFGTAKLYGSAETAKTNLEWASGVYTPEVTGTPAQQDVYSFGILAIEILTGQRPNSRDDAETLLSKKKGNLELITKETQAVLAKCISLNPKDRFSGATELKYALLLRAQVAGKKQNKTRYYAWVKLDDRVKVNLGPLGAEHRSLEHALKSELDGELFASPVLHSDGAYSRKEFWLISNQMKLHLVSNAQKTGWNAVQGKVASAEELEFYRRTCFPLTSLGIEWGIHSSPGDLNRSGSGFAFIMSKFDEWILDGRPSENMSQFVHQDIEKMAAKWLAMLDAREEMAIQGAKKLKYKNAGIEGLKVSLTLEEPLDFELVGTFWKVDFSSAETAEVIAHVGNDLELLLSREPRGKLRKIGSLSPAIEAGEAVQIRRQRDAISSLLERTSVQPKLGDLLAELSHLPEDGTYSVSNWRNDLLDSSKRETVEKALGARNFLLVQGPPGTGKTSFIAEYVYQELSRNPHARVLLVSQTHVALDNALDRLLEMGVTDCIRIGSADDTRISTRSKKLLIDVQMQAWMRELRTKSNLFIERLAAKTGIEIDDARALSTIYELEEVQSQIRSLNSEIAEDALANVGRKGSGVEPSLSAHELLAKRKEDERRLFEQLRNQLASKLTIPKDFSALNLDHVKGALLGSERVTPEFIKIVDAQAKWLDRVGSSTQLTPVFLRTRQVLTGTCLGFMSHPAAREMTFDICIIDEASRATVSQALVSMVRATKWIVVGDSNQLATSEHDLRNADNQPILQKYGLLADEIEESIFTFLERNLPAHAMTNLGVQYRMRDEIGEMVSDLFYESKLKSEGPKLSPKLSAYFPAVVWASTSLRSPKDKAEYREQLSYSNRCEILIIKEKLKILQGFVEKGLLKTENPLRVLVIAPYAAQIELAKTLITNLKNFSFEVEFNSIDAVQGREADIVYFSCVRQNESGNVGFLAKKHWRRINVALSRARYSLHIVGDMDFWMQTNSALSEVAHYIVSNKAKPFLVEGVPVD